MNDQQTIGKTSHFLEFGGYEQDRAPVVTQTHKLTVYELNRTDVDAARRLRHEQKLRRDMILATDDQLLLVTARQRARRQCRVWWANVKALNDLGGAPLYGVLVNQNSCYGRPIVNSEY